MTLINGRAHNADVFPIRCVEQYSDGFTESWFTAESYINTVIFNVYAQRQLTLFERMLWT